MTLRGINHIVLKVRNLHASDHFYRGVLGMERGVTATAAYGAIPLLC